MAVGSSPGRVGCCSTVLAVLALALGIGMTAAMYQLIYTLARQDLHFEDADRLHHPERRQPSRGIRSMAVSRHHDPFYVICYAGTVLHDTSSEALREQVLAQRRLGGAARLRTACGMSHSLREMAKARIRGRHPELDERGVLDRLVLELYGIRRNP